MLTVPGILALLIITHPHNDKFKNWIVRRLQIDWMLTQDREGLDVRDGFWKGLNAENLYQVFAPEEPREAELDLLADYTQLFGEAFVHAQKDIRPYLQAWAREAVQVGDGRGTTNVRASPPPRHLAGSRETRSTKHGTSTLTTEVLGHESVCDEATPATGYPELDVWMLLHYLHLHPSVPSRREQEARELAQWLDDALASAGPNEPLREWCRHWERRLAAESREQGRAIVQSLFLESIRRLHAFATDTASIPSVQAVARAQHPEKTEFAAPLAHLYMAVDVSDMMQKPLDESLVQDTLDYLRTLPPYHGLEAMNARLAGRVRGARGKQLLQTVMEAQTYALYQTTKSSVFSDYLFGVLAFYTLRLHGDLQWDIQLTSKEAQFWGENQESLISPAAVATLRLTLWQLQALLLPGADCNSILTEAQALVFRAEFRGASVRDTAHYTPSAIPTYDPDVASSSDQCGDALRKLLLHRAHQPRRASLSTSSRPVQQPSLPEEPLGSQTPTAQNDAAGQINPQKGKCTPEGKGHGPSHPTPSRNAFGQLTPAKRHGSPLDPRQSKGPRVGFRGDLAHLKHELSSDLKACAEQLRADIHAERAWVRENLTAFEERSSVRMDRLKVDVALLKTDLSTASEERLRRHAELQADLEQG